MKQKLKTLILLSAIFGMASCRPANVPEIATIAPNETAFLVPLEGDRDAQVKFDSEAFLEKKKIAGGRIEIPFRWRSTGYIYLSGEYIPTVQLIKVDRAPVTVQWQASVDNKGKVIRGTNDKAIWIESKDSVGFSAGFNVSAYIKAEDASKFLYMYASRTLKDVMDTEVHGRAMEVSQNFSAKYPLDELREMKAEMTAEIQKDVTSFFKDRGITITNLGLYGGFSYENEKIQDAIDSVFVAQQQKNTTKAALEAQNSINEKMVSESLALAKAAEQKANGAAKAFVIEAEGKAKAIQLESEALNKAQNSAAYIDIQRLNVTKQFNEKWDGKLPTQYIGSENVTTLMGIPDLSLKK